MTPSSQQPRAKSGHQPEISGQPPIPSDDEGESESEDEDEDEDELEDSDTEGPDSGESVDKETQRPVMLDSSTGDKSKSPSSAPTSYMYTFRDGARNAPMMRDLRLTVYTQSLLATQQHYHSSASYKRH